MFYVSNVLKSIYLLEEASQVFARHKTHKIKYKIDEFIDKLLASKKFDVLAEKFAQKAVERMINLKPELRLTKDFAPEVVPQKIPFNNVSYKTDIHLDETPSPLKNLSLKFKHFTKGVLYDIQSTEHQDNAVEKTKASTAISTTTIQKNTELASDDSDKSINISDLDSSLQDKTENKTKNVKHKIHKGKEKNSNKNTTAKRDDSDGSLSMENKKNSEIFSDIDVSENHKTNDSHVVLSDFDNNVRKDRALFSDVSKEESNIKNAELKKLHKKRIHREGNKLYTFQSSSDYDEYHQELERIEKEKNVFV